MSARVITGLAAALMVSAAAAQTPTSPTTATEANPAAADQGVVQVHIRPDFSWIDYEVSLTSFWEELPKLVLAGLGGWWIAVRVTNRWDLAKKRNEFDIQLAQDFYNAIGRFKAVGRQAEVLALLPNPPTAAEQRRRDAAREKLLEQAIELESVIDAMLAKVVLEDRSDTDVADDQQAKRLHVAGLVRVMVRNLREGIQHDRIGSPEFGAPEFFLSNRVLSDLGAVLYTRALSASNRKTKADAHSLDYLALINYRTADYKCAAAALAPAVESFEAARRTARTDQRRANAARIFRAGAWAEVNPLAGGQQAPNVGAALAVDLAIGVDWRTKGDAHVAATASALFAAYPNLDSYLVLAEQEARVLIAEKSRPGLVDTFVPVAVLPATLPYAQGIGSQQRAANLLTWHLTEAARGALRRIANDPIDV
jgi:hypothetical protein